MRGPEARSAASAAGFPPTARPLSAIVPVDRDGHGIASAEPTPDFHRRDLWDAITGGSFPERELGLQLFDEDFADEFPFDVLDPTKIIPEELSRSGGSAGWCSTGSWTTSSPRPSR